MEDEHEEKEKKKNPIWIVAGIFILLMFLVGMIPFWAIKADPSPSYIPEIDEVVIGELTYERPTEERGYQYVILDGELKAVADRIVVAGCNSGEKVCHAKALFYFVRDNFDYVSDPTAFDYIKVPKESLMSGGGDCDDASILLAGLLESVGIKTRLVFVPGHVYVEGWIQGAPNHYKVEDSWIPMDATCSSCGFGEIHWKYADDEKRTSIV